MLTIGLLHTTVRQDEKLILRAAAIRGLRIILVDLRRRVFGPSFFQPEFDVALERSVSTVKGTYAVAFLESVGIPVINSLDVTRVCEDKFLTSLRLQERAVPAVPFALVFNYEQALEAVEKLGGFPVVLKPPLGSWGRLLAKVNDADALEALLEHKDVLGSPHQKAIYIQPFIKKPGRDIRAFIVGRDALCAIYRESGHWITNTARGGTARNCVLFPELKRLCRQTAEAVGEGLLAVDIFETDDGLLVNEVNHTMEFKNSEEPTGTSISEAIIDYCLKVSEEKTKDRTNSGGDRSPHPMERAAG